MAAFQAVILVCLATTPPAACTEDNAVEIHSKLVDNELKCASGWEEIIARSAQSADVGSGQTYVRTFCRRVPPDSTAAPASGRGN